MLLASLLFFFFIIIIFLILHYHRCRLDARAPATCVRLHAGRQRAVSERPPAPVIWSALFCVHARSAVCTREAPCAVDRFSHSEEAFPDG
jgi:hypothetical protein